LKEVVVYICVEVQAMGNGMCLVQRQSITPTTRPTANTNAKTPHKP
jgi:hypothetical protein